MNKRYIKAIFFLGFFFFFVGCEVDRHSELDILKGNIEEFDELKTLIENKYHTWLDGNRQRLVFLNCVEAEESIEDYVCDDKELLKVMENLGIKEIRFEKKKCGDILYSEVYFQKSKLNHYPIVYYLYEHCGSGEPLETNDIYYQPVNDHWGLYIDSNFP